MDEILTPGHWSELQGKLREKYPELTDSDLQYEEAAEEDMLRMLEYTVRKTKKEMSYMI